MTEQFPKNGVAPAYRYVSTKEYQDTDFDRELGKIITLNRLKA